MFIFFSCGKLAYTWVCLCNFVMNWLTFLLQTIRKKSNERMNETKKDVLKKRFISCYFMLLTFSSPVKFSKSVFSGVNFRAKFEVVLQKQLLSIIANHSKSDFSTVN